MALPKPQVEKDLGEIIVANNPGPGLMQPTSASATTFKPPKGFTSWSALPGELTALLPSLGLSLPQPPYRVDKAHVVSYVNQGEVNPATGQPIKHQLWIIYGSGGE